MSRPFRIGLALGGGAARAFSHIGVIAGLEKHGIGIDFLTGTSMGAVIGAMYAARPEAAELKKRLAAYLESDAFTESGFDFFKDLDIRGEGPIDHLAHLVRRGVFNTMMVTRSALVSHDIAARNFAFLVDDLAVEETRLPFAAVALDLRSGEAVILDHGRLRRAVTASSAMPGILAPVEWDDKLLVDGGWTEPVPVSAARALGADFVIAVDAGDRPAGFRPPKNALDVIARADTLVRNVLATEQGRQADFLIRPRNGVAHWADFSTAEQAIARGEEEFDRRVGHLRRALSVTRWRRRLALNRRVS